MINNVNNISEYIICFDESGKNNEKINLIGGLLIPRRIFENEKIKKLNDELCSKKFKLHWTNYNGDCQEKDIIKNLIKELMLYKEFIKLNVIVFDKIHGETKQYNKENVKNMIYSKFPERVIYGLLRKYSSYRTLDVDIYIESETTYKKDNLAENIKKQLNIQSIYRGKNFNIVNSEYKCKNEFIGVELIDLFIGIIKSILEPHTKIGKRKLEKNALILELLDDTNFYKFLKNLKIYKWVGTDRLEGISFKETLNMFLNLQEKINLSHNRWYIYNISATFLWNHSKNLIKIFNFCYYKSG